MMFFLHIFRSSQTDAKQTCKTNDNETRKKMTLWYEPLPLFDQISWFIFFQVLHVNSLEGIFSFRTILHGICKNFGLTLTGGFVY